MASDIDFDEVKFQAHLSQGGTWLEDEQSTELEPECRNLAVAIQGQLQVDFVAGFKLSTGLGMEYLWLLLRPTPISDSTALEQIIRLEQLADRFDELRWQASASVPDLGRVMSSLAQAYSFLRANTVDASGLLEAMANEIQGLESKIDGSSTHLRPILSNEFESLRQALVFHGHEAAQGDRHDILVLSGLPTRSQMRLQSCPGLEADCKLSITYSVRIHPFIHGPALSLRRSWSSSTRSHPQRFSPYDLWSSSCL